MNSSPLLVVAALFLVLLVTGCTGQQPGGLPLQTPTVQTPPVSPSGANLQVLPQEVSGSWDLQTMGTRGGTATITPTVQISLVFSPDGTLSGYDGCNHYFGSANLTGTTTPAGTGLALGPVGSTKKYCSAVAEQEQQYLNILGKTQAYAVNGTQLTLTASTRDVLVYQRAGI